MKKLVVMGIFFAALGSHAQVSTAHSSWRKNFATIAFAGIGGAVLGLSTLSFYGAPQDHVSNITSGFFLGLAGGAVYVVTAAEATPSYDVERQRSSLLVAAASPIRAERRVFLPFFKTDFP